MGCDLKQNLIKSSQSNGERYNKITSSGNDTICYKKMILDFKSLCA